MLHFTGLLVYWCVSLLHQQLITCMCDTVSVWILPYVVVTADLYYVPDTVCPIYFL